jgi:hypothetical protein
MSSLFLPADPVYHIWNGSWCLSVMSMHYIAPHPDLCNRCALWPDRGPGPHTSSFSFLPFQSKARHKHRPFLLPWNTPTPLYSRRSFSSLLFLSCRHNVKCDCYVVAMKKKRGKSKENKAKETTSTWWMFADRINPPPSFDVVQNRFRLQSSRNSDSKRREREKERDKREWAHSAVLDEMDIIGARAMRIRAETTPKHYCTTSSRMLAAWRDRDREKKEIEGKKKKKKKKNQK